MLEYTDDYIVTEGIKIHYYRTGGGKPPFVLLHGATDDGLCWTPVAELLAEQYDVIMPDAQGHGLSDRLDPDFTSRRHTDQMVALMEELGIEKPIVMGHSMGADTTVNIAVTYPSLPKAIILEDPPWGITGPPAFEKSKDAAKQAEDFRNYLAGLGKRTLDEVIAEGRANNPKWSEAEIIPWAKAKRYVDTSLFSRPIITQRSYRELVPEIRCPTLLLIGGSGLVTAEVAENAAKLWQSQQPFQWFQIKDAGHNIRREQLDEFCGKLFCFLQDLPD
jgi:N-formylmaleamate deformylase